MAQHTRCGVMEEEWRKGPWTAEEDRLLHEYVNLHGEGKWNAVARLAGYLKIANILLNNMCCLSL